MENGNIFILYLLIVFDFLIQIFVAFWFMNPEQAQRPSRLVQYKGIWKLDGH